MGRNSRPRKPYHRRQYKPATSIPAQRRLSVAIFDPLKEVLEHIAHGGELHETDQGLLIYRSPVNGQLYEVPGTINAYVEIFRVLRLRDATCPNAEPLHRAAQDVNAGQVTEAVMSAALDCVAALHAYARGKPADFVADAAQSVLLRLHLDAAERSAGQSPDGAATDAGN